MGITVTVNPISRITVGTVNASSRTAVSETTIFTGAATSSQANSAFTQANLAFNQANSAFIQANSSFLEANNIQTRVCFAGNVTRHPVYREYLQFNCNV